MPAMSRPTTPAAISHAVTLSGCISSVRSIDVPPVERFAVARKPHELALRRERCRACGPVRARNSSVRSSHRELREHSSCGRCRAADPGCRRRSAARIVCFPSPITCAGTRSAAATTLPFDDEHAVVAPLARTARRRCGCRTRDECAHAARQLLGVVEPPRDAAAVVRGERLEDDRDSRSRRRARSRLRRVRATSPFGTGRPMFSSTRFVSSLSCAISTPIALV